MFNLTHASFSRYIIFELLKNVQVLGSHLKERLTDGFLGNDRYWTESPEFI